MTDSIILRPTKERERLADHIADDGAPTQKQPYMRARRLGTAWDRYCRDKDAETGLPLPDEAMTLTRRQIATGLDYVEKFHKGMWGGAVGSKYEASVSGSVFRGPPGDALEAQKKRAALEERLRPRYLISLIEAVLIDGHSAETWASATGRDPRGGMSMLRTALDAMGGE